MPSKNAASALENIVSGVLRPSFHASIPLPWSSRNRLSQEELSMDGP